MTWRSAVGSLLVQERQIPRVALDGEGADRAIEAPVSLLDIAPTLLQAAGIEVLAINPFNWETHKKFAEAHHLPFPVLFDPRGKYARLYKTAIIRGYLHKRAVYAVDKQGTIRLAKPGNPPVDEVLAALPG